MYHVRNLSNTNKLIYYYERHLWLLSSKVNLINWCSIFHSNKCQAITSKLYITSEKDKSRNNQGDFPKKRTLECKSDKINQLDTENEERVGSHFMKKSNHMASILEEKEYGFNCPIWDLEEVNNVQKTHFCPNGFKDKISYYLVIALRKSFDLLTRYKKRHNEYQWCRRIIFLETVAGVPGMVGAMLRHFSSLRKMKRDNGLIHTLLEEAENERMHLLISLQLINKPSILTRVSVIGTQFAFLIFYTIFYIISPKYSHRFVGYLEEEAVRTYTDLIEEIDKGLLPGFERNAPKFASVYYGLPENATIRDLFLAMRRDESHHRDVNHKIANIKLNGI
ncbi:Alternative oxidase family protein [Cryptosporidium meleagridis]|uniref:Alternative oxidase family protein n=1 Tax=Cryptosporidium meleagridis TaxID=93969 RepID=A0A2P4Z2J0_9CRYT|nr:Alternative oxidase family protein [Cryptosporidium meleagridis]